METLLTILAASAAIGVTVVIVFGCFFMVAFGIWVLNGLRKNG